MVSLVLDPEGAGWIKVSIVFEEQEYEFHASDVGPDSLLQIASATLGIASLDKSDAATVYFVEFYCEPELWTLTITTSKKICKICLYKLENTNLAKPRELGSKVNQTEVVASSICMSLYKALRDLKDERSIEYFEAHWRGFPVAEFAHLRQVLKH